MYHHTPWFLMCTALFVACKAPTPEPAMADAPTHVADTGLTRGAGASRPPSFDMSRPQPTADPDMESEDMNEGTLDPRYTHVFVGTPVHSEGAVCAAYKKWREAGPAPPVNDATIFNERYYAPLEDVTIAHGPKHDGPGSLRPPSQAKPGEDPPFELTVRFPLDMQAFKGIEYPIDEKDCAQMDALLAHPHVVLFAYKVYEDHGNSLRGMGSWDDLGVDPRAPNKGFDTLAAAQEYASMWKPTQ